jgi:hypothetical protein
MLITTMEDANVKHIKQIRERVNCSNASIQYKHVFNTWRPSIYIKYNMKARLANTKKDYSHVVNPENDDHHDYANTMVVCEEVIPLPMDLVNIIMDLALD